VTRTPITLFSLLLVASLFAAGGPALAQDLDAEEAGAYYDHVIRIPAGKWFLSDKGKFLLCNGIVISDHCLAKKGGEQAFVENGQVIPGKTVKLRKFAKKNYPVAKIVNIDVTADRQLMVYLKDKQGGNSQ
jgi:hypothetical protein